jgi:tetratricopeptide (TPR) repeat protein
MAADERPPTEQPPGREPLSAAKLKRLEKVFEIATAKAAAAETASDFDYVSDLLQQCVSSAIGNPIYVRAYIENLQKKYGHNRKGAPLAQFKERAARSAQKKALAQEQWDEVVRQGLKVLTVNPWDTSALTAMATAANKSGDRDCELVYLESALKGAPKDPECNRMYAKALGDRNLIDQAIAFWHRVEEVLPNDEEAKRTIAVLTVQKARSSGKFDEDDEITRKVKLRARQQEELSFEQKMQRKIQAQPDQPAPLIELAQFYVNEDRYEEAERLLTKALELSDGQMEVREKLEDCQLRRYRQQIAKTEDPEKRKLLEHKYFEKEVEVYRNRVARYPNNLGFKYELGYRLMKVRRYDEAIRELQTAQNDPRRKGMCLLVLGECFQQIKQYPLALKHYEASIGEIPDRDAENRKRALYLAGRLALALKNVEAADKHLTALAALDFTYKDVSQLLDKVGKLRDNSTPEKTPAMQKADESSEEQPRDDRHE